METTALTILPHLGNMKHSPKIHIERPTNKSNLKVTEWLRAREELFWEAAEDKCCWYLGNTGDTPEHGQKCQADWLARMIRHAFSNKPFTGCKLFSVQRERCTRASSHFWQDSVL